MPDSTGWYFAAGTYLGSPSYMRMDGAFYIWKPNPILGPLITVTRGVTPPGWHQKTGGFEGDYGPMGTATGTLTNTAVNPHTKEQQDICQDEYKKWANRYPRIATPMLNARNAWLNIHGRQRHVLTDGEFDVITKTEGA